MLHSSVSNKACRWKSLLTLVCRDQDLNIQNFYTQGDPLSTIGSREYLQDEFLLRFTNIFKR